MFYTCIILYLCHVEILHHVASLHISSHDIIPYYIILLSCVTIPLYPMISAIRTGHHQCQSLYHITISYNRKYWADVMMSGVMIFTLCYIILYYIVLYYIMSHVMLPFRSIISYHITLCFNMLFYYIISPPAYLLQRTFYTQVATQDLQKI